MKHGEKPEHSKEGMKPGEKPEPKKDDLKSDKDNEGQGHAYGKNKGGLEGRNLGQSRQKAKLEQKQKEQELGTSVEEVMPR